MKRRVCYEQKKMMCAVLGAAMSLSMLVFAGAANFTQDAQKADETDSIQIYSNNIAAQPDSIEVIPNEEMDKMLPNSLVVALDSNGDIAPYGTSKPSSDSIWNLTNSGAYYFTASTSNEDVYSNYVFTGHMGWVKVHLVSEKGLFSSDEYTFKLFKRGLWDTTVVKYTFKRNSTEDIEISDFNSDDKVFFSVGGRDGVKLVSNSYIGTKSH